MKEFLICLAISFSIVPIYDGVEWIKDKMGIREGGKNVG